MATIVTRAGKGSPLTHDEVDDNFDNLNTDKVETSAIGTAAAANTGDFATAAQGALADSALQNITGESIENLSDVASMTPSDGQALVYGSGVWSAADMAGGIAYTRHTANVTMEANQGVIADTSGGTFTVTLPASPAVGDTVVITDGADWATTNLTVGRNGSTIESDAADMTMDLGGVAVQFTYDGTTWQTYAQIGAVAGLGTTRVDFVATAGQTDFSVTYSAGFIDVYLNGIKLIAGDDFTATNGTTVVLTVGAAVGDTVDTVAYSTFSVADTVSASAGGTFAGDVNVTGNVGIGTTSPSSTLHVNSGGTNNVATFESTDGTCQIKFVDGNQTTDVVLGAKGNDFYVQAGGAEKLRILDSGNVGIGKNNPATPLDVDGTITAYGDGNKPAFIAQGTNNLAAPDGEVLRLGHYNGATDTFTEGASINASNQLEFTPVSGTWTTSIFDAASGGNASPTTATGQYSKIGNMVWVNFRIFNISISGMTSGNNCYIRGHGFTPTESAVFGTPVVSDFNLATGDFNIVAEISTDGNITLREIQDSAVNTIANVSQINGADIRLSGWFKV